MKTILNILIVIILLSIGFILINQADKKDKYLDTCKVDHNTQVFYDCENK